jgi:hypothetical protein
MVSVDKVRDTMFGLGWQELLIIFVVILFLLWRLFG